MAEQTDIHRDVSEHYAKAASRPGSSCCGGGVQKGVAVKFAGYSAEELEALPADAVENSFGCGDPVAFANVEPGQTVLDLGSGAGIDLLLAAEKVGPAGQVIGVDMTDVMIEKARKNTAEAGYDTIEVRKGLIEELPVEDASVDWVISNCVINLSPDKPRVFAEIARVLKPGGRMAVSDIMVQDLPAWALASKDLYSTCVAGAISEDSYTKGLAAAGLADVEVTARLVYEGSQVEALIESEVPGAKGGSPVAGRSIAELAGELQGKIWSAKVIARKPSN